MKHQWWGYLIVALLSIGAGVAIAGPPNNVPVDSTIIPPPTTEAPVPTLPATTLPPQTTAPTTSDQPTTTQAVETIPNSLPDRSDIVVATANGAGVAGAAGEVAARLEELGYIDVTPLDGTEIVAPSVIYHAEGFEDAALRLADDVELVPELVAPLADAPQIGGLPLDVELLVYVGLDLVAA